MLANFRKPLSLRAESLVSFPSRYSTGSVSKVRPLHSLKPATAVFSISRRKLYILNGSTRVAMRPLPFVRNVYLPANEEQLLLSCRTRRGSVLTDTDNHKFGGLDRGNTNADDESPITDIILRHRAVTDSDEEGFLRFCPHQCSITPDAGEDIGDTLCHPIPKWLGIGLEDYPLCALIERRLDKDEEAAHIHVFPLSITGDTACAPDAQATPLMTEIAQDVNVVGKRIENVLLALL